MPEQTKQENVQPQQPTAPPVRKDTSPKAVFLDAVKTRIAGNKDHGWGVDDSMAVIKALWEDNTGEAMDSLYEEQVKRVINPSAFRQRLEDAGALNKATRKVSSELASLA